MTCKGRCKQVDIYAITSAGVSVYQLGFKRCSECEKYLQHDGNRCPCCNTLLRTHTKMNSKQWPDWQKNEREKKRL